MKCVEYKHTSEELWQEVDSRAPVSLPCFSGTWCCHRGVFPASPIRACHCDTLGAVKSSVLGQAPHWNPYLMQFGCVHGCNQLKISWFLDLENILPPFFSSKKLSFKNYQHTSPAITGTCEKPCSPGISHSGSCGKALLQPTMLWSLLRSHWWCCTSSSVFSLGLLASERTLLGKALENTS